jgi:hypothetical protein
VKQTLIDLAGCHSITVSGTGIRMLTPDKNAANRLSDTLNVPSRLIKLRQAARRGIGDRELFLQDDFIVGLSENGEPVHLLSSLLVSRSAWRGGWCLVIVSDHDDAAFTKYLAVARAAIIADLRKERASGGSRS